MKNWNENGIWEGFIRLNPHSNWVIFSLLVFIVFIMILIDVRSKNRMTVLIVHISEIFINLLILFNWKLIVTFVYF